jgi:hypothetical protein
MTSAREPGDKAWDYVRLPLKFQPFVTFEDKGAGIFELIANEGLPSKVASNRPDGSYATKDLFSPHASIPHAWKYVARLDDTIVLMNGEKVTPINFEQSMRDNELVTEAVMFGNGKSRVGLIVILSSKTLGLSDQELESFLEPALTKANATVPVYAQSSWDMVKILPAGTDYPRTDKGTVIRAAFYSMFNQQIEEQYESTELSTGELCLSIPELRQYLRKELSHILTNSSLALPEDTTDFFSAGIDSLQAIRLRSVLNKTVQTNGRNIPANVIFEFPSIQLLANELYRLRTGGLPTTLSVSSQMQELISRYSKFNAHHPEGTKADGHYLVSISNRQKTNANIDLVGYHRHDRVSWCTSRFANCPPFGR